METTTRRRRRSRYVRSLVHMARFRSPGNATNTGRNRAEGQVPRLLRNGSVRRALGPKASRAEALRRGLEPGVQGGHARRVDLAAERHARRHRAQVPRPRSGNEKIRRRTLRKRDGSTIV